MEQNIMRLQVHNIYNTTTIPEHQVTYLQLHVHTNNFHYK